MVSEKSLGFGKFGLGKEKIQITKTVLVVMSQIWDLVLIGTKALKWSQISPSSARKSQISFQKMLRSLGLGLGLETFAKFLRVSVSVSKNLVGKVDKVNKVDMVDMVDKVDRGNRVGMVDLVDIV